MSAKPGVGFECQQFFIKCLQVVAGYHYFLHIHVINHITHRQYEKKIVKLLQNWGKPSIIQENRTTEAKPVKFQINEIKWNA